MATAKIELLISDLDNTLYDWVTFFTSALYEMVHVAAPILEVNEETLLDDLQTVHKKYHNSEQPFALLETRTVVQRFGDLSRREVAVELDPAFYAFNQVRDTALRLYPGVRNGLMEIASRCVLVAHTEASIANAVFRLRKLGIHSLFRKIYAVEDSGEGHPEPERAAAYEPYLSNVRLLAQNERKPDTRVLLDICRDQGIPPDRTLYVGDSISRDIGMARSAGAWTAWAKYGTEYDRNLWSKLVRVTHWNDEDVRRAQVAEERYGHSTPHRVLEKQFDELLEAPRRQIEVEFLFNGRRMSR